MFQYATKPQGFFDLVSDSVRLYSQTLKIYWKPLLGASIIWTALFFLLLHFTKFVEPLFAQSTTATSSVAAILLAAKYIGIIAFALLFIALLFISSIIFIGFTYQVVHNSASQPKKTGLKECWQQFKPKMGTFIIALIIATIISLSGLLILILPGIFLGICFKFIAPLCVRESSPRSKKLIKQSIKLVWGNWFRTFFRFIFITLIMAIPFILIVVLPLEYAFSLFEPKTAHYILTHINQFPSSLQAYTTTLLHELALRIYLMIFFVPMAISVKLLLCQDLVLRKAEKEKAKA